jgi:hypothetical protein
MAPANPAMPPVVPAQMAPAGPPPVPKMAVPLGAPAFAQSYNPQPAYPQQPPAFIPGAPRAGAPMAPPMPPGRRPASADGQRFGVEWWALLAAAPMVVVQFAAAQSVAEQRGLPGSRGVIVMTAVLWPALFSTVAALGLWWMFRHSRKAATIAFLVVYASFTLPDVFKLATGPSKSLASTAPAKVFVPDVESERERIPATTFKPLSTSSSDGDGSSGGSQVESGGMRIVAKPGVRRAAPPPEPAVVAPPKPTGPRVLNLNEALRKASDAVRDAQAKTAAPTQRWTSLGASDLSGVKSEEDLADRIEALDALAGAMRGARDAADGARDQLRKDLAAAKLPPAMRDNHVAVWASDQRLEEDKQVAFAAEKFTAAWRSQLVLLQREWGKWWVDGQTGRVGFKNQQTGKQYDRGASDVDSARKQLAKALGRAKGSLLAGNASVAAGR